MGSLYDSYIKTIENEGTRKALKSAYKSIGDYEDSLHTLEDVKKVFYAAKVDTIYAARNLCSQFRNFANYIQDSNLLQMLENLDYLSICIKVRELGVAKYFTYHQYQKTFEAINNSSVMNPYYIQTLFQCIYEGVYSRDFSVIINLRGSDIHNSTVTCRRKDGTNYAIAVSEELSTRLLALAATHTWTCRNKNGYFERNIYGEYNDSCFKVEKRDTENRVSPLAETYINTYRNRLRENISTELGYNISAYDIYISGLMYRVSVKLQEHGIEINDAFSKNNRNAQIRSIIETELTRCHYEGGVSQFKQRVEGHIEIFNMNRSSAHPQNRFQYPSDKRVADEILQENLINADIETKDTPFIPDNSVINRNKLDMVTIGERLVYPRNRSIAQAAIKASEYKCEVDDTHPTFVSRYRGVPYTEPHHLIPLCYSDYFNVSLDVPENIVSLCSNCHNELHYGINITDKLKWLYECRKKQLSEAGINITFEELMWMYNAENI